MAVRNVVPITEDECNTLILSATYDAPLELAWGPYGVAVIINHDNQWALTMLSQIRQKVATH